MIFRAVEDTDLIRRAARGSVEAYNLLVSRWEKRVYNYLLRITGNREDALDLTQDVFLKAYQNLGKLDNPERFAPWLYRIALNVARDAGRRQRREPTVTELAEPIDGHAADDPVCRKEFVQVLAEALDELPEPLRQVLVLRHYEDLNFEQIARLTGTPASTLKSRFAAALNRLRTRLQERGWGPEETTV